MSRLSLDPAASFIQEKVGAGDMTLAPTYTKMFALKKKTPPQTICLRRRGASGGNRTHDRWLFVRVMQSLHLNI